MSVMINIFFQVSGVAQSGKNIGVRYSRYASFGIGLSRLELIHSYPSSSSNSSSELEHRCKWFFADLIKKFPEFSDNALKIFKLVSHGKQKRSLSPILSVIPVQILKIFYFLLNFRFKW